MKNNEVQTVDEGCFDGAVFDAEGPIFDEETKEAYGTVLTTNLFRP